MQADPEKKIFGAVGSVAGLDAPWWYEFFVQSPEFRLTDGQVDGSFSFWSMPNSPHSNDVSYYVSAVLAGGRAAVSRLSPREVAFAGEVCVTPEGVDVQRLDAQWAGAQLRATGAIFNWSDLAMDLDISVRGLDSRHLASVVPGDVRESLPDIGGLGSLNTHVQMVGSWPHVSVHVVADSSGRLRVGDQRLPEITLADLHIEGWMPDSAEVAVLAEVRAGKVEMGSLTPGPSPSRRGEQTISASTIENLRVELLYAGQTPVLETSLAVDRISINEVDVANVVATVQAAGSLVRIEGLQGEALGGRITGHGLIQNAFAPAPTVHFDGLVQDIDLAALHSLPLELPADLGGHVNVLVVGSIEDSTPAITARMHTRGFQANGLEVDDMVGLVEVEGDVINFPLLQVTDPKGVVWARGRIDADGNLTAKLAAAELDIGAVGQQFDQPDLSGTVYLTGEVTGNWEAPEGRLEFVVFKPSYQEHGADVVAVTLDGNVEEMRVEELWAARGAAIITGSGQLSNLDFQESNADLAGELEAVGLQAQDVAEWIGRPLPLTGSAEANMTLGGTLRRPAVSGWLQLVNGSYRDYSVDAASVPFELVADILKFHDVRLQAQDAVIQAEGKIWDIYGQAQYSAQLTARGVYLQDIAPLQQMGLQVAGQVEIPLAHIESGQRGPEGQGRLVASEVMIGNEQIHNVDTLVTIRDNQIQLQRTNLQAAGGQLEGEATYDWEQQQLAAEVSITDADIPRLLRLAALIAVVQSSEESDDGKQVERRLRSLSLRTEGKLTVRAGLAGSLKTLQGTIELELAKARLDRKSLPDMAGQFAVKLADGKLAALTDINVEATQGEGLLILTGRIEPEGEMSLVADASSFNLALWREWLPPQLKMGGTMGLTIVAKGPAKSPRLRGSVDILNANFQGVRFDLVSVPVVTVSEGRMNIDTLILKRGEQQIVMDGYLPFTWDPLGIPVDEEMKFAAKVENTALSFFPPLIDEFVRGGKTGKEATRPTAWAALKARGAVNSEISIAGTIAQPVLDGYLKIAEGKISRPSWQQPLEDINIDLRLARRQQENVLEVAEARGRRDETTLIMEGKAYIDHLTAADFNKNRLNLSVQVQAPQFQLWPGTTITNLQGEVKLATQPDGSHLLTVKELGGKLGKGSGYLSGTSKPSQFTLATLADNEADLRLELKAAQIKYPDVYDGVVEGLITLQNPQPHAPVHIAGALTMRDARLGLPTGAGEGAQKLRGFGADFPSPTFDVAVAIGPNVVLSSAGINAPLQPNDEDKAVLLSGTPQRPLITGRAEVAKGKTTVPTGTVVITSLGVSYKFGPTPTSYGVPAELALTGEVGGSAERVISSAVVAGEPVGPIHIFIDISGKLPDKIKVTAESEPPLTEEQIYAILGTEPFGELAATGRATDLSQILSEQFMGLLAAGFRTKIFEPLEEELKSLLGLSEFSVYFAFEQPLEVRIGKYVMKDLSVSYRHTVVAETTDKWDLSLSYELPRRLRFSYSTNESGEAQVRIGRTYRF